MALTKITDQQLLKIPPPLLTNPTTTSETIVVRWQVPANFLSVGMSMLARASYYSAGTGTVLWRLRIGASGTISDTIAATLSLSAAQAINSRGNVNFNIYTPLTNVNTITASGFAVMGSAVLFHSATAIVNPTIVPTSPIFISITATVSVSAANVIVGAGLNVT